MTEGLVKGRTLEYREPLDARVQRVTPADVNRVLDVYLRGELSAVKVADLSAEPK